MPLDHNENRLVATPLCWLHGFTQTGASAHQFQSILAGTREMLTPDLARHGANALTGGSLEEIADAVDAQLPVEQVDLGGYSFGARVALHVALRHPQRIRRLALIGATRGIAEETERRARRERDELLATRIEQIGLEPFLDEWLSQPMFANLPDDASERASRQGQRADSLASSLREAGTGTQRWLGDQLDQLTLPLLAIAGASDERFSREARAIARGAPHASAQLVPGAGHATHLHQPVWSARLIENFLSESRDEKTAHTEQQP